MSNEIIYRLRSYIFIASPLFFPSFQAGSVTPAVDAMTIFPHLACFFFLPAGTMVVQVAATDADDPTYGNSARVVYSIIHGQPYFSVEPKTGWCSRC